MPCARFTPPSWSTTRVISRMTDSVKPWTRFEITRRTICPNVGRRRPLSAELASAAENRPDGASWNDHVTLERIDLHPAVPEPLDPAFERALVALELERHPAVVGRHVGAADVDHDVEVLHEAIDDGLLDERRRKGQANACAGHCRHLDQRPPAIAGTIGTSSPSFSVVFWAWRNRMSSWLT